jgi:hypothetical protein
MSEPDAVTAHTHETEHSAAGVALLPHKFRSLEDVVALLAPALDQVQEVEDALWDVLGATLADATGHALDQLGELLVWPRGSLSDADYRAVLLVVVKCNRSAGTGDELLQVVAALMGATGYTLEEFFPAAVLVSPEAAPSLGTATLHTLLKRARAAGVKLHTLDVYSSAFRFASGERVETDNAHGFSDIAGTVGGRLAGVLA